MPELTHTWRPFQGVRATVLGLAIREDRLLLSEVTEDDGTRKGWRAFGGGIEFGETSEACLHREFQEELGATLRVTKRLGVIENIFEHHGDMGHEIIQLFQITLIEPGQARAQDFIWSDGRYTNRAAWVDISKFRDGHETLFPDGALALL